MAGITAVQQTSRNCLGGVDGPNPLLPVETSYCGRERRMWNVKNQALYSGVDPLLALSPPKH